MSDITDKIGKLLTQAEHTNNEAERDAFMQKAQALATTYAIDLELARQRQRVKTERETPEVRHININFGGRLNRRHFCQLIMEVGKVNDLKFNIAHNSSYVIAFGFPSDIDVTERIYASLAVQMAAAADAAISAGEHKLPENMYRVDSGWTRGRYVKVTCTNDACWQTKSYGKHQHEEWREGEWKQGGMRSDARVFRTSFYEGFIYRVGERMRLAKREAEQAEVTLVSVDESGQETSTVTTGALVLVGKREQVNDFYKEKSTAKGSWNGYRTGASSGGARASGSRAANSANLHGSRGSLPGQRRAIA